MDSTTGRYDVLAASDTRTEIIRVRLSPEQKSKFAKFCSQIGVRSASLAYKLVVDAMNGKAPEPIPKEATSRPLRPRRQIILPASKFGRGEYTTPCLRV